MQKPSVIYQAQAWSDLASGSFFILSLAQPLESQADTLLLLSQRNMSHSCFFLTTAIMIHPSHLLWHKPKQASA
jgi:hypothetical protein